MNEELEQLAKAKLLAMTNNPTQMLPKVLETAITLYKDSTITNLKTGLAKFCSKLILETLDHKKITNSDKTFFAAENLHFLLKFCENEHDVLVYKYSILSFTAAYSLLFELVAKTSDLKLWNTMQDFKNFIVSNWNTSYPLQPSLQDQSLIEDKLKNIGCKMATAKFITEIVIVHTSNSSSSSSASSTSSNATIEPICISIVPNNHPVISNKQQLESEAKKLFELLLNYLIEEPFMNSSMFTAIINCLAIIIKKKPHSAVRICVAMLKFNIDAKYQIDGTSVLQYRLSKRFVERCYKNFVQFCLKNQLIKNSGPLTAYYSKLAKISQTLHVIGEETKSKGILNYDPKQIIKLMPEKNKQKHLQLIRNKLRSTDSKSTNSDSTNSQSNTPSVAPQTIDKTTEFLLELQKYTMSKNTTNGFFNTSPVAFDNSYGAIYSLMNSKNSQFDLSQLPQDIAIKLCSEAFYNADTAKLISGLSIVASRYTDLMTKNLQDQSNEDLKKRKLDDDEQTTTKRLKTELSPIKKEVSDVGLEEDDEYTVEDDDYNANNETKPEQLMKPVELSNEDKMKHLERVISRIMKIKDSKEKTDIGSSLSKDLKPLQKIKLLQWNNQESWLQILIRLATRGVSHNEEMSDLIRQTLVIYFLEDFNNRVSLIIEWLNEEWFYETAYSNSKEQPTYDKWSLKMLDALIPFLENQHRRLFIRLVSELPSLTASHIEKVKPICLDPARSSLGFQSLKFLVMFRPPVKIFIKEFLENTKKEDSTTAEQCDAILTKFFA